MTFLRSHTTNRSFRFGFCSCCNSTALARLGSNQIDLLPVVSRAGAHQLLGVVTLRDVLQSSDGPQRARAGRVMPIPYESQFL
jgi:hypothetical protein